MITVHRSQRRPCLIISPTGDAEQAVKIPFDYSTGPDESHVSQAMEHMGLSSKLPAEMGSTSFHKLVAQLWTLFRDKEGVSLSLTVHADTTARSLDVSAPRLIFDPTAYSTAKRHAALHSSSSSSRSVDTPHPSLAAHGMTYVALDRGRAAAAPAVGTLVNGAGLAMNTVDALAARGVRCANFLDTGGRATAEGVAAALRAILHDDYDDDDDGGGGGGSSNGSKGRVCAVFVNAFGGLTRCDMVARGVLAAVRDMGVVGVPLVVRLRGTNEEEGRRVVAESGLDDVFAFDGFDEAAAKLRELLDDADGDLKG
jgi:succinyl-CoA synthetase alpha subunit